MKKIILLLSCTYLFLLFSCVKEKTELNSKIVDIDFKNKKEYLEFSTFSDTSTYVILETKESSLIKQIDKVFFYNNYIIIGDCKSDAVFIFNSEGKFKNCINSRGRGPGEYMKISNLFFDNKNKLILIWDLSLDKILYYKLNGDYIKTTNLNSVFSRQIMPLNNKGYLGYNFNNEGDGVPNGLFLLDEKGEFDDYLFKSRKTFEIYSSEPNLHWIGENNYRIFLKNELLLTSYSENKFKGICKYNIIGKEAPNHIEKGYITTDDIDVSSFSVYNSENFSFVRWSIIESMELVYSVYDILKDTVYVTNCLVDDNFYYLSGPIVDQEGLSNVLVQCIYPNPIIEIIVVR